jgi:hypothetical protein
MSLAPDPRIRYAGGMKLLVLGVALAFVSQAHAAPRCDRCKDLPKLEKELFEQEYLQHEFREWALGNRRLRPNGDPKDTAGTMRDQVIESFNAWLKTPAGGGKGGNGRPELGTDWSNCTLVLYVTKTKTVPFDEKKYREQECKEIADYLLAHENKHVEQCKKNQATAVLDVSYYMDYAAIDSEAYGAGIRDLRKTIAKLAKECGWQGSTNETKKNPDDGLDEDVVPTKKEAAELAKRVKK